MTKAEKLELVLKFGYNEKRDNKGLRSIYILRPSFNLRIFFAQKNNNKWQLLKLIGRYFSK